MPMIISVINSDMNTCIIIRAMMKECPGYKEEKGEGHLSLPETLQGLCPAAGGAGFQAAAQG